MPLQPSPIFGSPSGVKPPAGLTGASTFNSAIEPKAGRKNVDGSPMSIVDIPMVGMIAPSEQGRVAAFVSLLAMEARQEREKWEKMADVGLCIFNYGDYPKPDPDDYIINRIQNDVIAIKDIQFKQPPSYKLIPMEVGGVMACYWVGPAMIPVPGPVDPMTGQPQIDPNTGQPIQANLLDQLGIPPEAITGIPDPAGSGEMVAVPIDPMQARQAKQMLSQMALPDDWVIEVDAKFMADFYQKPFDVYRKTSGIDEWSDRNTLINVICGQAFGFYEFDIDKGHIIQNHSIRQIFLDPQKEYLREMAYAGLDIILDAGFAKKVWPHLADVIDKEKKEGFPYPIDGQFQLGEPSRRMFYRNMVTMRIWWFRDSPMPLTEQEALNGGHVTINQPQPQVGDNAVSGGVAAGSPSPAGFTQGEISPPGGGNDNQGGGVQSDGVPTDAGGASPAPQYLDQDGQPANPASGTPGDDGFTAPSPNWPQKQVLRRLTIIGPRVVSDQQEDHYDIPIYCNVCIPAVGTPYGFGIPYKLRHPGRSYSSSGESIELNMKYLGSPAVVMPASVKQALKEDGDDLFINPGKNFTAPDNLWNDFRGKILDIISPPTMPEALIQGRREIRDDMDDLSGRVSVLRGEAPTNDPSGRLVQNLQNTALGLITALSKRTQEALRYLAMLQLNSIIKFVDVDHLQKIVKKYPRPVLAALHLRHSQDILFDFDVSMSMGAGLSQQQDKQDALAELQIVDPISGEPVRSLESVRQACNLDNDIECERNYSAHQRSMVEGIGPAAIPPPQPGQKPPGQGDSSQ